MAFASLASYLELLHREGDLTRVEAEVDPADELDVAVRLARRAEAPALLLPGVRGHETPVAANLWASDARLFHACAGRSAAQLAETLRRTAEENSAGAGLYGWMQRLATPRSDGDLRRLSPRHVKTAESQQIVRLGRDVDLRMLPWIGVADAGPPTGRWLTAAEVFFFDAVDRRPRVEEAVLYFDVEGIVADRAALAAAPTTALARLLGGTAAGKVPASPVAVALGGDPAGFVAASAPLPCDLDRMLLAGFLRDQGREVIKTRTSDLMVPADADVILEGELEPAGLHWEGDTPPRWPTPHASAGPPLDLLPTRSLRVTAVTHRANPVVPHLAPTGPPNDQIRIRRWALETLFPLLQRIVPDIVALDFPESAAARHAAVVAVRKTYAAAGHEVAHALWSTPWGRFVKTVLFVDADVDPRDGAALTAAVMRNVDWRFDCITRPGPADPEDPTADMDRPTVRLAIDATTKCPGDAHQGGQAIAEATDLERQVLERWEEFGLPPETRR